jgi:tetratricopeptide (TPR) repeat protein
VKNVFVLMILTFFCPQFFIIAQEYSLKPRDELLSDKYSTGRFVNNYEERTVASKRYYDMSLNAYKNNNIEVAIQNMEMALSIFTFGIYFYKYGDYLIEVNNYEDAEKAYKKTMQRFVREYPYRLETELGFAREDFFERQLFSFDSNGVAREIYFSYYNLACLYSLQNNVSESLNWIIQAIQHGYPYIDHIFNDSDLLNLFNSNMVVTARNQINKVYNEGFELKQNIQNKVFSQPGGPDVRHYEFYENGNVEKEYLYTGLRDYVRHGTYAIKNWLIIIQWNYEDGQSGVDGTEVWNGGANQTSYSQYEYFRYNLNEIEIIPYMEITNQWDSPNMMNWTLEEKRGY